LASSGSKSQPWSRLDAGNDIGNHRHAPLSWTELTLYRRADEGAYSASLHRSFVPGLIHSGWDAFFIC